MSSSTMYKKRSPACNGCAHPMCDVIVRNRPERALGFVVDSIITFEQHFGKDCREEVREMSLEAVSKYGAGTPYERDERLLPVYRILAWYSKSMTPDDVYRGLFEKRLFHTCAQFYIDWAEVHLRRENWKLTAEIIFYAINTCGTYHPLLNYLKQVVDVRLAEQRLIAETVTMPPNSEAAHELQVRLAELPQVLPHLAGPFIGHNPYLTPAQQQWAHHLHQMQQWQQPSVQDIPPHWLPAQVQQLQHLQQGEQLQHLQQGEQLQEPMQMIMAPPQSRPASVQETQRDFGSRQSLSRPCSSLSIDDQVFKDFPPIEAESEAAAVAAAASAEVAAAAATYVLNETAEITITEISFDEDDNKENVPPTCASPLLTKCVSPRLTKCASPSSRLAPSPGKHSERVKQVLEDESIRSDLYVYSPAKSQALNASFELPTLCMPTILMSFSEMAGRTSRKDA